MPDICIIGGGASGLAAAITAAREKPDSNILIIEKKEVPGKKLAATGNGKCNLTNAACERAGEILDFFKTLGIYTRTDEEGRVYPYSSQAKDVVYGLISAAESLGVDIRTGITAEKITVNESGYTIATNKGTIAASKILIASGGKSAPQFGTSGDGYTLARQLGHTVNRLAPVLTGIEVKENLKDLKGVRVKALVKLLKDGKLLEEEAGEVQFNEDGISGICVMNLSRFVKLEDGENFAEGIRRYTIEMDFMPELTQEQVESIIEERVKLNLKTPEDLLLSLLPQQMRSRFVSDYDVSGLARAIKKWPLSVSGTKGWKVAQCTSGGVATNEINPETMESLIHTGLYFSGEVVDYDGPCGGFNLQYAWETGIKAGKAMANVL